MNGKQLINRQDLINWYGSIRSEIIEYINNEEKDYIDYTKLYESIGKDEFCKRVSRIIDERTESILYQYMDDLYTLKSYNLYFLSTEEYEYCKRIKVLMDSLYDHINHMLICVAGDNYHSYVFLFKKAMEQLEDEFTEQYGV